MLSNMTLLLLFHFLLFALFEKSTANAVARYEFENVVGGPGAQRSPWRSNASSASSLHMFKGDKIHLDLCLSRETRVQLNQFIYSNDGISDEIKVHFNKGQIVDTIRTESTSGGWGDYWDTFKSYKGDGQSFRMDRPKETLVFEVVSADCFGTEFDAIEIKTDVAVSNDTFFCGGKLIRSLTPSPCAVRIDATTLPTTPTKSSSIRQTISTASTTSHTGEMNFQKTTSSLRSPSPPKGLILSTTKASLTKVTSIQTMPTTAQSIPTTVSPQTNVQTNLTVQTSTKISTPRSTLKTSMKQSTAQSIGEATSNTISTDSTTVTSPPGKTSSPPASHTTLVKSTTLPMSKTISMTTASTKKQPNPKEIDDKPENMKNVSTSSSAPHTTSVKSTMLTMSKETSMPTAPTPKPPKRTEIDDTPENMKKVSTSSLAPHTTSVKSTIPTMGKSPTIKSPNPPTDTEIEDKLEQMKKDLTTTRLLVTKTTTPTSSTVPKKDEEPLFLVKQLSFPNACLSTSNIRLRYTPLSLKGVSIIARANAMRNAQFNKRRNDKKNIDVCRDRIWQIGKFNDDHADLGPIRYYNIDFDVNADKEAQMPFPGLINPKFTQTITIRYVLPGNISIGNKGTVFLTLGMVNVSSDVAIGVQYHIRRKKNPSDIEYVTLTPEQNVVGWDIPARAISPSLENVITLHFNMLTPTPLKVDFLRLESLGEKHRLKKQIIARVQKWRVRAFIYKQGRNKPQIKGLTASVDGGDKESNLEKVVIFYKPNKKSLTIYRDGRIIPFHHIKPTEETTNGSMLTDTSGVIFGNANTEIETVDIYTKRYMVYVNIVYTDSSFVHLSLNYTNFRTKIKVLESSVKPPAVEFFSTYITDYIAAVNEIVINNNKRFDIMDKNIVNTKGQRYTFLKTTPNQMYKVDDEYEFVFPKQVIPK